jgi:hypothetical protein
MLLTTSHRKGKHMFYVVPKDRIKCLSSFDTFAEAKADAQELKRQTGENYDIIQQMRMWSTGPFEPWTPKDKAEAPKYLPLKMRNTRSRRNP